MQEAEKMAAVPQAAFAARKIKQNEEKRRDFKGKTGRSPTNYNSKFMDSIWGQYNRYSVHNLKKVMDKNVITFSLGQQDEKIGRPQRVENKVFTATEVASDGSSISFGKQIFNLFFQN